MKTVYKSKGSSLLIIVAITLAAVMSGCTADDVEGFFDLTPAERTPPNGVHATPVNAPEINAGETTADYYIITEKEPENAENFYEKPDTSKFTEYPNMWVEKYTGEYKKSEKTVYLTFDDGPSENTEAILKVLKDNNVKATFFVIPDESEECADRLRIIAAAGHTIGVHSVCHNYLTIYADVNSYVEDFAQAYDIIVKATNQKPWLYRFPGGSVNQYNRGCREGIREALGERGFVYYDWNVDSNDWRGISTDALWVKVTANAEKFSSPTVLMHDTDTRDNTVAALDSVIKSLKNSGYSFAPITREVEPVQYGVNF